MLKKVRKVTYFPYFVLALIVIVSYWGVWNGYFQHDEWAGFARNLTYQEVTFIDVLKDIYFQLTQNSFLHFLPLLPLLNYFLYTSIGVNYLPYAFLSLTLHSVNSILVFVFAKKLTGRYTLSFAAATLFAVNIAGFQAVTYIGAFLPTQLSATFAILSLILFFSFLANKSDKYFFCSIVSLFISLFVRETAVALFLFIPIVFFLMAGKNLKKQKKYPIIFFLSGVAYFLFRFSLVIIQRLSSREVNLGAVETHSTGEILYNLLTFPIKMLSQSIIPSRQLISLSKPIASIFPANIAGIKGTTAYGVFVEREVSELLSLAIFSIVIALTLYVFKRKKNSASIKLAVILFLFVVLNSFIYVFSVGRSGVITLITSRNFYFPQIGTLILGSLLLWEIQSSKLRYLMFITVLSLNIYWLKTEINDKLAVDIPRKNIVHQIQSKYPNLPQKVIFYTVSDSSFYGMPENEKILPFETGLGQILLIKYFESENFSSKLLEDNYLGSITQQEYKEVDGRGFGYFRDISLMVEVIEENGLDANNIIAFSYNSKLNHLQDITSEIRNQLELKDDFN